MELRERVARAINPFAWYDDCQDQADYQADAFRKADAAIAAVFDALREPSEAMIEVGSASRPYREDEGRDEYVDRNTVMTWQAMLSAARPSGE